MGIVDRCSLPENARFDRKEHVVCVDEAGTVRREKKPRQTRWSKYDAEVSDLQNVSVGHFKLCALHLAVDIGFEVGVKIFY